jgi:hypothetical protein
MRKLSFTLGLGLAAGVAVATACASTQTPRRESARTDRMDTTEFRRPEFRTIYEAVRTLHPEWLQTRGGPTSLGNATAQSPVVGVFIEGELRGYGLDKLTEFVGGDVKSIRHISPSESLGTYGSRYAWGGIVVTRAR